MGMVMVLSVVRAVLEETHYETSIDSNQQLPIFARDHP
jgi:hypothetical protein